MIIVVTRTVFLFCRERNYFLLRFCVDQQYLVKISVVFTVCNNSASDIASSNNRKTNYIILFMQYGNQAFTPVN